MRLLVFILCTLLIVSCNKKKAEFFNIKKPYSLEIKKERSYFQAEKIASRLNEMGLSSYVIEKNDSIAGKWFCVLSGALENTDSVSSYRQRIEREFRLSNLQMINYSELDSATRASIVKPKEVAEQQKIITEKPNVPDDVFSTIKKFPNSNALYLDKINIAYFPKDNREKGIEILKKENNRLNHPIYKKMFASVTTYADVKFIDNLYGDAVTLMISKLNPRKHIITASLAPVSHDEQFSIAEEYADILLNSGNYEPTEKAKITVNAYVGLYGYRVSLTTKEDMFTYYILIDENMEYIYFTISTDKTEKEILKLLSEAGKGDGLLEYNEFYNSFNVIPDNSQEQEIFLGLFVDKLSWEYAKAKNNAKWAQEMVGYWVSASYFYNTEKGIWHYSIFDLLTENKQKYIETLYASVMPKDSERNIYGGIGHAVYFYEYYRGSYLKEINFSTDRFACALSGSSNFTEQDLIIRGESIQFKKGGHKKEQKPTEKVV